jgi:hypothetical protein
VRVHGRGKLTGDDGTAIGSHGGAVERLGHAADTEMARRRRATLSTAVSDFQVTGGEDILTLRGYRLTPSVNHDAGDANRGGEVTGGGILLLRPI